MGHRVDNANAATLLFCIHQSLPASNDSGEHGATETASEQNVVIEDSPIQDTTNTPGKTLIRLGVFKRLYLDDLSAWLWELRETTNARESQQLRNQKLNFKVALATFFEELESAGI